MWSDERGLIKKILVDNSDKFPRQCPGCGKKAGHVFFSREHGKRSGSTWAWCSACKEYFYTRSQQIPDWWKNMASVTVDERRACPDRLDDSRNSIDEWANRLLREWDALR